MIQYMSVHVNFASLILSSPHHLCHYCFFDQILDLEESDLVFLWLMYRIQCKYCNGIIVDYFMYSWSHFPYSKLINAEILSRFWLWTRDWFAPSNHFYFSPCLNMFVCAKSLQSCPTLCDPIGIASQAPLSMEFSRQE